MVLLSIFVTGVIQVHPCRLWPKPFDIYVLKIFVFGIIQYYSNNQA